VKYKFLRFFAVFGTIIGCQQSIAAMDEFPIAAIRAPVECYLYENVAVSCAEEITSFYEANIQADLFRDFSNKNCKDGVSINNKKTHDTFFLLKDNCNKKIATDSGTCSGYSWVHVQDIKHGRKHLKKLIERLASGEPFDLQRQIHAKQIVEADMSTSSQRNIALCEVFVIDGTIGPPRSCEVVAMATEQATLVRTYYPGLPCNAGNIINKSGSIIIEFKVYSDLDFDYFPNTLSRMLREELKMSVRRRKLGSEAVRLFSTTGLRESLIVEPKWREAFDFEIFVMKDGPGVVSVSGTTNPIVSRQASGSLVNYHGLDDALRNRYATAFDNLVKEALIRSCSEYTLPDDRTIECQF